MTLTRGDEWNEDGCQGPSSGELRLLGGRSKRHQEWTLARNGQRSVRQPGEALYEFPVAMVTNYHN